MISNVLSKVVFDLDHYLNGPLWDETYAREIRERIIHARDEADEFRSVLEMPPSAIRAAGDRYDQTGSTRSEWIAWMMSEESAVTPALFLSKGRSDAAGRSVR
jgi:hypothetical protein